MQCGGNRGEGIRDGSEKWIVVLVVASDSLVITRAASLDLVYSVYKLWNVRYPIVVLRIEFELRPDWVLVPYERELARLVSKHFRHGVAESIETREAPSRANEGLKDDPGTSTGESPE
ncbi:hypothetical protein PENSPDRAFT_181583 [Peniophora sp. CONT]|nr:hypothetical protein PENSPDRAFT_181583 [Peniophora sp. CONT]